MFIVAKHGMMLRTDNRLWGENMAEYKFNTNELKNYIEKLKAGDRVLLSGVVYTSRDAAHKRIYESLQNNEELAFDLEGAVVYYAGPTPTPEGMSIGSCGPTTSSRMDVYTPYFLENGLKGMIGKGERSKEVCDAIVKNKAIYFCAIGGAGALAAKRISRCEVVAFDELGCESTKKLEFLDFPLIVAIDCNGGNLFLDRDNAITKY